MKTTDIKIWDREDNRMCRVTRLGIGGYAHDFEARGNRWDRVVSDPQRYEELQYIGLNDKNDTKIFEGDIIKVAFETKTYIMTGEVHHNPSWKICTIGYKAPSFNETIVLQDNYFFADLPHTCDINVYALPFTEVIGNKFENPELLEPKSL